MTGNLTEQRYADLQKFTHKGLEFDYIERGLPSGEPIVLLHGFPQHAATWQSTTDALVAAGYRTLALDQRGYSPDARPRGVLNYRLNDLVSDVTAFIREVGGGRVHLVGHDLGSEVAWVVAATTPHLLRSLTVASTPHPRALTRAFVTSDQTLRSWYISFLQLPIIPELVFRARQGRIAIKLLQQTGLTKEYAREYVRRLLESSGALEGAINWYRAFPLSPRLVFAAPPVSVPTMYVWSSDDSVVTRTAADYTGRYVKGPYSFRVLEGVSHWIPEEAPTQLAELIMVNTRSYGDPTPQP